MLLLTTLIQIFGLLRVAPWVAAAPTGGGQLQVTIRGGVVYGMIDPETPSVRQFLSIPYAQPPTGRLRFFPPKPFKPFRHWDARSMGPSCMQYLSPVASLYTRDVLEFNVQGANETGTISEDCLTLSVWAPVGNKYRISNLPVFVWIHGGGFQWGGVNTPYQLPPQWIQRTQGHIVVSMNYRLNIFGFPNAEGLEDQNLGLLDQRLAIEWVRDNIAAFGGDPARITLFGESAGAIAVGYYSYAYSENPISRGIILQSGTELMGFDQAPNGSNFNFVAEDVGCGGLGTQERLSCMQRVPAARLEDFVASYEQSGKGSTMGIWAVIDEKTIFSNYTARAGAGQVARLVSGRSIISSCGNFSQPAN